MSKSYEKLLEDSEEEIVQTVLTHGKFKAMDTYGLKDYISFSKWWERHKPKPGTEKWFSSAELAYIAGLFDAEVAFGIQRQKTKTKSNYYNYNLFFSYTKMDCNILSYLSRIFGGTVKRLKNPPSYKHEFWNWHLSPKEINFALNTVYPYLRIKKVIARICIEFYKCYYLPESISSRRLRGRQTTIIQDIANKLYSEYIDYRRQFPGGLKIRTATSPGTG